MAREQVELPPPESWSDFDEFYRASDKKIMRFVMRLGGNVQEAEDAMQEAMTAVYGAWDRMTHPSAYARVVAERRYLASAARHRREQERLAQADWTTPTPARDPDTVIFAEEARRVLTAVRSLPYAQRRVMAWHLDEYSTKEIAAALDQPEATIRSNLRHARDKVKQIFELTKANPTSAGRRADDERPGR
jgi:RNA polymerase sigma factor (sigma-70 family)